MLVCKVVLSEDHELTHDIRLELNTVKRCLLSIMRKQEIAVCARVCAGVHMHNLKALRRLELHAHTTDVFA